MITTRQYSRPRTSALALVFALILASLLFAAATASANSVRCKGTFVPAGAAGDLTYDFLCSEDIKGYSVVSNLSVAEFSTTADVLDPTSGDPVSGQTFSCEGLIPSNGFGCSGSAINPNRVHGTLATDARRCVRGYNQMRVWVVAVDATGVASGPQPLRAPKCAKAARKSRR